MRFIGADIVSHSVPVSNLFAEKLHETRLVNEPKYIELLDNNKEDEKV
jgi:hypothetical protein